MILPDSPITKKDKDLLNRFPLAKKISELIKNHHNDESFVIGIEGRWGSGKTSFVNLIRQELKDDVFMINFNPWNFTGQNELIEDFFASLISVLHTSKTEDEDIKKIKKYALKLTRKSEVSFSPEVSFWGINVKAEELFKFFAEKNLEEERENINKLLRKLSKRILVIIDDIDRLDKEETRLILKLVKMTANFPNTIFMLAYDRDKVVDRINEDGWDGEEYLKKIIQLSFTLPEPNRQGLSKILFNDLDNILKEVYGEVILEGENKKRWGELRYSGFEELFKTIRDIKRYISSLALNWSMIGKDEVNMIDFMGIEAIRIFSPKFYSAIRDNKSLFTGTISLYAGAMGRDSNAREALYNELLEEYVPKEVRTIISDISKKLFPQLDFRTNYPHEWQQTWRGDLRVCSEERFDFYFQLAIPEGAISEVEVANVLEMLNDKNAFSKNIIRINEEKRLRAMLAKILDKIEKLNKEQKENLMIALWDLENNIEDGRIGMFDFDDVSTQTNRIGYQILKTLNGEEKADFVNKIIKATNSLYSPVSFTAIILEKDKKDPNPQEDILDENKLNEIKEYLAGRIESYADEGRLQKEDKLLFLLYRWREWAGEEKVQNYIKKLIQNNEGLLIFLRNCVSKVFSTGGDYNNLDKKSISGLYPLEEVEKKVNTLTEVEINKMDEKSKEAINLFKNPPKEW
jgi:predicted KAP-like P-loop ATPase